MSLKRKLKSAIRTVARMPFVSPIIQNQHVRRVLEQLPGSRALYPSGWEGAHPFDVAHGIDASGFAATAELDSSIPGVAPSQPYGPSQPSSLRAALATLTGLETSTFLDLGCGKGRPLFVASEFPFHDIIGVELSPSLATAARNNAAIIAKRHPTRTPVRIEVADASTFPFPDGDFVLFLYNPFSPELTSMLVTRIEAALAAQRRSIYVVYCDPVFGAAFDASPALTRRFASMVPYAQEELGYGPDTEDAVVVWQGGDAPAPTTRADAKIIITTPGVRAELAR